MGKTEIKINAKYAERTCSFQFSIIKAVEEHCHPRKAVEDSVRKYFSFHYITYGSGVVEKDGVKKNLSHGDCFLLFNGEHYRYYPNQSDPWSYIYIDFELEGEDVLSLCGFSPERFYMHLPNNQKASKILRDVLESFRSGNACPLRLEGCFLVLISYLMEVGSQLRPGRVEKRTVADDVIIFINNNYRLNLSLEDIAAAVGFSAGYVSASMTKTYGWSPIQYLNLFRIATACELLRESKYSIKEVSAAVGFSDPLYFSRIFTKIKGLSPRAYKKEHAATDDPFEFLKKKEIDFR